MASNGNGVGGRPSKLTDETISRLTAAFRLGATPKFASAYAGIGYSTFRMWMVRGDDARQGEYREFVDTINSALADGVMRNLAAIDRAVIPQLISHSLQLITHLRHTRFLSRIVIQVVHLLRIILQIKQLESLRLLQIVRELPAIRPHTA